MNEHELHLVWNVEGERPQASGGAIPLPPPARLARVGRRDVATADAAALGELPSFESAQSDPAPAAPQAGLCKINACDPESRR